jgi:hypothetical protein
MRGPKPRNDGKRVCYKCKIEKELIFNFHKDSTCPLGYSKVCKECYKISNKKKNRQIKVKTDITACFSRRCSAIKHRSKIKELQFDLTPNYLLELYNKQQGKCYYTNRNMKMDIDQYTRIDGWSVDRLTPNLGYVMGNVVLCCFDINAMKNDRTEDEFREYLSERILGLQNYISRES